MLDLVDVERLAVESAQAIGHVARCPAAVGGDVDESNQGRIEFELVVDRTIGGVALFVERERPEFLDDGLRRSHAGRDACRGAIEFGTAEVAEFGADRNVARAHRLQHDFGALVHQHRQHLHADRER